MSKRGWLAAATLASLTLLIFWSSSLIGAAPALQDVQPTDQQQTMDALVQQYFQQTAHAPETVVANQTIQAALGHAQTSTAEFQGTVKAAFAQAMTATALAPETEIAATVRAQIGIKSGIFDANFLTVPDGIGAQMTTIRQALTSRYNWNVKDISLDQLLGSLGGFYIDDSSANGQVLVIPGGSAPLTNAALKVIQDYVAKGGNLIIFAGTNLNDNKTSLATTDNLDSWLYQDFGMRFDKNVVLDPSQAFQSPLVPVATDLDSTSFITTNGIPTGQGALVFEVPNSITIRRIPPTNVIITPLARSTTAAYAKINLSDVLANQTDKAEDDRTGPFVLAASAENTQTHAHVVLFGSTSVGNDTYAPYSNIDNLSVSFNSLVWAANYSDYFSQFIVPQQQTLDAVVQQRLQQTDVSHAAQISYITATAMAR